MIPIQQVLSRIRWDRAFGDAEFAIGYYDRLLNIVVRVPMSTVIGQSTDHQALQIMDPEGLIHSVPLHRIRVVYRNGELIWQRSHAGCHSAVLPRKR